MRILVSLAIGFWGFSAFGDEAVLVKKEISLGSPQHSELFSIDSAEVVKQFTKNSTTNAKIELRGSLEGNTCGGEIAVTKDLIDSTFSPQLISDEYDFYLSHIFDLEKDLVGCSSVSRKKPFVATLTESAMVYVGGRIIPKKDIVSGKS